MKNIRFTLFLLAFFCFATLFVAPSHMQAQQTAPAPTGLPSGVKIEQKVAMRDGVNLAMNIFLPEGSGPFPVVLQRTPYGKDAFSQGALSWTKAGFAFVV